MKVLALTRYGRLGASSRVRTMQYLPALADEGLAVDSRSLLGDDYVRDLYAGRKNWPGVARAYARRARELLVAARAADVLWIEKELWPWMPGWIERLFWQRRPVVLDYDDAIFHNYDRHRSALVRALYGGKIDRLMRAASCVLVGNDYLAQRARAAGARDVRIVPTAVDTARYVPAAERTGAPARALRVVWIGTPGTVKYLQPLADALAQVASVHAIELRVIGARVDLPGVASVSVDWSEATEAQAIAECDIGIMPLPDSDFERGKSAYKLIQYMACGLPVVASPVGANRQVVRHGANGFLAVDEAAWVEHLARLIADAPLRARLGAAGRADVEAAYSLQVNAPRIAAALRDAASPSRAS